MLQQHLEQELLCDYVITGGSIRIVVLGFISRIDVY